MTNFYLKFCFLFCLYFCDTLAETLDNGVEVVNASSFDCSNDHLYDNLDVREVFGKWYVYIVYTHLREEGVNVYKSCPVATIWETDDFPRTTFGPSTEAQLYHVQHINAKFRQEYRHLRLLWDEAGRTSEYALFFRNETAGYWQVVDGQNGTLTQVPGFRHFSGTVQVLKAVNDHLLLSFCQEPVGGRSPQLYSVLFSREPGVMPRWEINSVHTLLQNKKLSVASRRMVCGNEAVKVGYSMIFSILSCAFAYVFSQH